MLPPSPKINVISFRHHGYNHDYSNAMMSWSQFCKEPLPDRSFTFWDWFHAVMKLTKEDLRGLWIDGYGEWESSLLKQVKEIKKC